jgi:hypothetical protein
MQNRNAQRRSLEAAMYRRLMSEGARNLTAEIKTRLSIAVALVDPDVACGVALQVEHLLRSKSQIAHMKECGIAFRRSVLVTPDEEAATAETDVIARLPGGVAASLIETMVAQGFHRERRGASPGWIDLRGHTCSDPLRKAIEDAGGALAVLPRFVAPSDSNPAVTSAATAADTTRDREITYDALPATDALATPATAPNEISAAVADDVQALAASPLVATAAPLNSAPEDEIAAQQGSTQPAQTTDEFPDAAHLMEGVAATSPSTENAVSELTQQSPDPDEFIAPDSGAASPAAECSNGAPPAELAIDPSGKPAPNPAAPAYRRFGRSVVRAGASSPKESPMPEIIPDFLRDRGADTVDAEAHDPTVEPVPLSTKVTDLETPSPRPA